MSILCKNPNLRYEKSRALKFYFIIALDQNVFELEVHVLNLKGMYIQNRLGMHFIKIVVSCWIIREEKAPLDKKQQF